MSKFVGVVVGSLEIAVGAYLEIVTFGASTPLTSFLISSGIGMVLSGIGTLMQGTVGGTTTASRNPIAPWNVIYGRAKVGGTLVFVNSFGDSDKYLDLIFVLNSHQSKSVDALMFQGQRIRLDSNGCSFSPTQQTVNIASISRSFDVVTVNLVAAITDLQTGDSLQIKNVSDHTFNGVYAVTVTGPTSFTYVSGGLEDSITNNGAVETLWPDYKAKVHMEVLLGNHTQTFPGMLNGTPYDGDPSNLVTNPNNPWTSQHLLLGRTCAFLRLHYNDQIFANGLPTISFHVSGKCDIYDPRASALGSVLARPTTLLNGWGPNAHEGAYEEGVDQGFGWGLSDDTTFPYQNPDNAVDGNFTDAASAVFQNTHVYAGCIWQFAATAFSPAPSALWLNIYSEVQPFSFTGRSAGIWYSIDGGSTWTQVYNSPTHPLAWDNIELSLGQDISQLQVMAFTDAHDDMGHYVYDVQLATGPGSASAAGTGYTENAALCIADYLAQPTWGFKAHYGTEIPLPQLIAAANICDEPVALAAGGTEPRYACNGSFPLTMKRGEVLQNVLTSCGGRLTYSQGQFVIWPAAWQGITAGGPLPPASVPTPPAPQEFVAWSYSSDTGITHQSPNGACSVGQTSTDMVIDHGLPLGGTFWSVQWTSFKPPLLPPDAIITHIYALISPFGPSAGGAGGTTPSNPFVIFTGAAGGGLYCDLTTTSLSDLFNTVISYTMGVSTFGDQGSGGAAGVCCAVYYKSASQSASGSSSSGVDLSPVGRISAGPFRWREKLASRDLYNGVKGTYISPANNWQASDIPPYAQDDLHGYLSGSPMYPFGDANLAADGGERRWLDIQLPFTISVACAQRLCKIELMRRRQQGTGTFSYNMMMYMATALDIYTMTLPLLSWTNKLLELQQHRFTLNKTQVDGTDVTLLGTEIDVQETDPSIYDWSPSEELSAAGFQYSSPPGSTDTGGTVSYVDYQNTPALALSQTDATHIALAPVSVAFANAKTLSYNARTITIPDPGSTPTWYYVTIADPDFLGDQGTSTNLIVSASAAPTNVGVQGNIYLGAIQCTHAGGGSATVLPGGWPAPQAVIVGS
jgi:hypothetical protein